MNVRGAHTMPRSTRFRPPGDCPNCGAAVARGARVCRECGASESDGWSDARAVSEFEHPDDFDYDDFTAREFGGRRTQRGLPRGVVLVVILVALAAFVLATVLRAA